jgi:hypothetical protein
LRMKHLRILADAVVLRSLSWIEIHGVEIG